MVRSDRWSAKSRAGWFWAVRWQMGCPRFRTARSIARSPIRWLDRRRGSFLLREFSQQQAAFAKGRLRVLRDSALSLSHALNRGCRDNTAATCRVGLPFFPVTDDTRECASDWWNPIRGHAIRFCSVVSRTAAFAAPWFQRWLRSLRTRIGGLDVSRRIALVVSHCSPLHRPFSPRARFFCNTPSIAGGGAYTRDL